MAEKRIDVESLLSRTRDLEKEYEWLGAAKDYEEMLISVPADGHAVLGEILERQAYALHRAALQADDYETFRDRTRRAMELYGKAKEDHTVSAVSVSLAKAVRCDAMIAYLGFWHSNEPPEKKMLLSEAWNLTKRALDAFEASGGGAEFGKTFNRLSMSAALAFNYEWDSGTRERMVKDALAMAEKAANSLSSRVDADELARTYVVAAGFLSALANDFVGPSEYAKIDRKALEYLGKAGRLSEKTVVAETPVNHLFPCPSSMPLEEYVTLQQRAVDFGKRTKDRLITGYAMVGLTRAIFDQAATAEDSDTREALLQKVLEYTDEAGQEFRVIGFANPKGSDIWTTSPSAGYYMTLAYFESDREKKRVFAEKGRGLCEAQLELAEATGIPGPVLHARADMQLVLTELAKTEIDHEGKRTLLEQAVEHSRQSYEVARRLYLPNSAKDVWLQGWIFDSESELAYVEEDIERKVRLYREIVLRKKTGADLLAESVLSLPLIDRNTAWTIGVWRYECGTCSLHLFKLTDEKDWQGRALEAFDGAAEWFKKVDMPARAAESHWESGKVLDILGEHEKSSEEFLLASGQFRKAEENITQLADFYRDHASYMEAWSEIEMARHYHIRQEPASSRDRYAKAAAIHESIKGWKHLSTNYSAWASIENAEDLSRKEGNEEAIQAFQQAAELFRESKGSLETHLSQTQDPEEKQMYARLVKTASMRGEYCRARVALEEARMLDKKGEERSSSDRYGRAVDIIQRIYESLESEQDRREMRLILTLAKAWQLMTQAEAEASPEFYQEAARLFEEAKSLSPDKKLKSLTMGHSRFCRALEAGARFTDSGDLAFHSIATDNLESAAKYYLKAGLDSASEYARASELLFDAYVQMAKATKEDDHNKKARLYAMAEKTLQASAASYEKAGQSGKKELVLRLLGKVRQDRELAFSLTQLFSAPDEASTTVAFSSPTSVHENAVGLERFEHADVQSSLIARPRDMHIGQDLSIVIELVNAGRGTAQLTKVEDLIPRGFDLVAEPEKYRVEDSYLNMKGRRLDALKTEEVKLVLRPTAQGEFKLKPRIMYLDESGKYKSCEPEPINITVRELGISGWLKGPDSKR